MPRIAALSFACVVAFASAALPSRAVPARDQPDIDVPADLAAAIVSTPPAVSAEEFARYGAAGRSFHGPLTFFEAPRTDLTARAFSGSAVAIPIETAFGRWYESQLVSRYLFTRGHPGTTLPELRLDARQTSLLKTCTISSEGEFACDSGSGPYRVFCRARLVWPNAHFEFGDLSRPVPQYNRHATDDLYFTNVIDPSSDRSFDVRFFDAIGFAR